MKNWMRIVLVCCVLVGGTAFFAYQSLNQFNIALDDISAYSFAIAKISPIPFSDKIKKEQIPISDKINKEQTPTTTPEIIGTSATSTDLELSFIFPQKNNEIYIGCTYQLSFQSSATISSLETALIDAGSRKTIEPIESGLASENKIKPNSQSLDWKVGWVWPGEYYIKSNINDVVVRSKVFTIKNIPKDINAEERKKICKESRSLLHYLELRQ